jgi:hypothetical protein
MKPCFHGNCGKVCPTDSDFFWLISFHQMWMLFLSSFINFCLANNLLWLFLCFSFFKHCVWQLLRDWKNSKWWLLPW